MLAAVRLPTLAIWPSPLPFVVDAELGAVGRACAACYVAFHAALKIAPVRRRGCETLKGDVTKDAAFWPP